jgi:maltooligosyltrehalose trehalohydrolase
VAPWQFINFLQNHDQVANSARGLRGHQLTSPAKWRAMTALLLLMPSTPMLFQGQEFSASTPFLYFADFDRELAAAIRKGRSEFLRQFPSLAAYQSGQTLDDPGAVETFTRCKLDFAERDVNAASYALHRDLLRLRRDDAAFRAAQAGTFDGAVIGERALALRYFTDRPSDARLLIVNLGCDVNRDSIPEPLVAPPPDCDWQVQWSSETPEYGGAGMADIRVGGRWSIPAECAVVLAPGAPRTLPQ